MRSQFQGSTLFDAIATNWGDEIANIYVLGKRLSLYPILLRREPAETRSLLVNVTADIRRLVRQLNIPDFLIEEFLSHPEKHSPGILVEILTARKSLAGKPELSDLPSPIPPWFAKAGVVSAAIAFVFLCALVVMAMLGKDVPMSAPHASEHSDCSSNCLCFYVHRRYCES